MKRRDQKPWPVSRNIWKKLEIKSAFNDEFVNLEEKVRFIAERMKFDLEDAETTDRLLCNVATDKDGSDLENAPQAKWAEHFLSLAYAQLLILSNKPSDVDALNALCLGNWVVGLLGTMDLEDPPPRICLPCAIHQLASQNGKNGAEKKLAPIRELKEWAKQKYQEKNWASANRAAYEMKDEILAHGRSLGVVLSEQNAQRTIAGWLRRGDER